MFFNEDINTLFVGGATVSAVYMGSEQVWPTGLPVGTTFDFEYTGTVQSVELPKGKYKLQCWGAQGGTSYGSSNGVGSKGGYSEGILTLTEKTTLYVFVGGQGSRGSSTSLVNGGWNGGGASTGYSAYTSGNESGRSNPACGGGATDISTVTSTMSYSNGRTNRSSASLLARCIVAGGGAGGSYIHTSTTTTSTYWENLLSGGTANYAYYPPEAPSVWYHTNTVDFSGYDGEYIEIYIYGGANTTDVKYYLQKSGSILSYNSKHASSNTWYVTVPSGTNEIRFDTQSDVENVWPETISYTVKIRRSSSSTSNSSGYSNKSQQGGGTSGKGQYPGTQTSAGSGGGFGYGANQETTNYMYCSGGGGGGWYGGGSGRADGSTGYINYSGGGSGFVNTAANASSRPSGYTGLQLDSGTTTAGNTSHPSKNGGTEVGHSGNGFARIIAVDKDGNYPIPEPTYSINWEVQNGTWNDSSSSSAVDGLSWTCTSPGSNGSTVLRCTFSGISSITFNCVYNGESNFDYLTVGSLDTACSRTSYGISLKGTSGTAKDITFTCDTGEHYVEFCYSKDGSVDTSPDNATVYIKSYS